MWSIAFDAVHLLEVSPGVGSTLQKAGKWAPLGGEPLLPGMASCTCGSGVHSAVLRFRLHLGKALGLPWRRAAPGWPPPPLSWLSSLGMMGSNLGASFALLFRKYNYLDFPLALRTCPILSTSTSAQDSLFTDAAFFSCLQNSDWLSIFHLVSSQCIPHMTDQTVP